MPFRAAAGEAAAAVILVLDVHDDLRTRCFGAGVDGICVCDDNIGGLGFDWPVWLVRILRLISIGMIHQTQRCTASRESAGVVLKHILAAGA